jgi:hypothetical protein
MNVTSEQLQKVQQLITDKPIRTGDLIGLAQRAGVESPEFWAAMQLLEKGGLVRSRMVSHPKKGKLLVSAWVRVKKDSNAPPTGT